MSGRSSDNQITTFWTAAEKAPTVEHLKWAFIEAMSHFSIDRMYYGCLPFGTPSKKISDDVYVLDNYGGPWTEEYQANDLIDHDITALHAIFGGGIMQWSEVEKRYYDNELSDQQARVYLGAKEADLNVGLTIPIPAVEFRRCGGLGLAFKKGMTHAQGAAIVQETIDTIQRIAIAFHINVRRFLAEIAGISLTEDELAILHARMDGKKSVAISQDRAVSVRTVDKMRRAARKKLGADVDEEAIRNGILYGVLN